jgi:hypothetical protein
MNQTNDGAENETKTIVSWNLVDGEDGTRRKPTEKLGEIGIRRGISGGWLVVVENDVVIEANSLAEAVVGAEKNIRSELLRLSRLGRQARALAPTIEKDVSPDEGKAFERLIIPRIEGRPRRPPNGSRSKTVVPAEQDETATAWKADESEDERRDRIAANVARRSAIPHPAAALARRIAETEMPFLRTADLDMIEREANRIGKALGTRAIAFGGNRALGFDGLFVLLDARTETAVGESREKKRNEALAFWKILLAKDGKITERNLVLPLGRDLLPKPGTPRPDDADFAERLAAAVIENAPPEESVFANGFLATLFHGSSAWRSAGEGNRLASIRIAAIAMELARDRLAEMAADGLPIPIASPVTGTAGKGGRHQTMRRPEADERPYEKPVKISGLPGNSLPEGLAIGRGEIIGHINIRPDVSGEFLSRMAREYEERLADRLILALHERKGLERGLRNGLAWFVRRLDPEIAKSSRSILEPSIAAWNWIAGDGDAETSKRRRQALETWPILAGKFIADERATRDIDEGRSPLPRIAALVARGIKNKENEPEDEKTRRVVTALTRLRGVSWQATERRFYQKPETLVELVENVSAARLPALGARAAPGEIGVRGPNGIRIVPIGRQWSAFVRSEKRIRQLADEANGNETNAIWNEKLSELAKKHANSLLSSIPPSWQRGKAWGDDCPGIDEAVDAIGSLRRSALIPVAMRLLEERGVSSKERPDRFMSLASQIVGDAAWKTTIAGRGAKRIAEASAVWHAKEHAIENALFGNAAARWSPLTEPWEPPEGRLRLVPLITRNELKAEGEKLRHCVGSYASKCLFHGAHVISVKDAADKSVSTAELRIERVPDENGKKENERIKVVVVQHKALKNGRPSAAADAAIAAYVKAIERKTLIVEAEKLDVEREKRVAARRAEAFGADVVGYDPFDGKLADKAFAEHAFLLDESAKAGADAWLKNSPIGREMTTRANSIAQSLLDGGLRNSKRMTNKPILRD